MDLSYLPRVLVALLLAAFLGVQARRLQTQPKRRRAFTLATVALVVFAALNASLALGAGMGVLQMVLAVVGVALFVGAVASLLLSLSAGESRNQREQIAAAAREYRARRNGDHR